MPEDNVIPIMKGVMPRVIHTNDEPRFYMHVLTNYGKDHEPEIEFIELIAGQVVHNVVKCLLDEDADSFVITISRHK